MTTTRARQHEGGRRVVVLEAGDDRHGTHAGYVAGCRCPGCATGHRRARKARELRALRGGSFTRTAHEVDEVLARWERLGISRSALGLAAGLRYRPRLTGPVLEATYQALVGITEDDIPDGASVYAALTRTRIGSLMAAGHLLGDMPVTASGAWRTRPTVGVALARAVRDHYRSLEFTIGSHPQTAVRARNAGHRPPLSWDDPDTLAWPEGEPTPEDGASASIDEVLVRRIIAGEYSLIRHTSTAERTAVVRLLRAAGRPLRPLELCGIRPSRYLPRAPAGASVPA